MSAPTLYWSEQGAVCCGRHAPYPGTDTWANDGWRRVTDKDRQQAKGWGTALGFEGFRCEVGKGCGDRGKDRWGSPT